MATICVSCLFSYSKALCVMIEEGVLTKEKDY